MATPGGYPDVNSAGTSSQDLNAAPPRPPRQSKNLLQLGPEGSGGQPSLGMMGSDPSVQILQNLQESRNSLMKLAASLPPPHSDAIQQMVTALMTAVPQMMADIVSGQVPNQGVPGGPSVSPDQSAPAPPPAAAPSGAVGGP